MIGHKNENEGSPLASLIYGHRLMQGQHFHEYLMEFLLVFFGVRKINEKNVLADLTHEESWKYRIEKKLGLRRLVFYKTENKISSRFEGDRVALNKLEKVLQEKYVRGGSIDEMVELLRSYLAVEDNRSWYAKSLFPVNHSLLFGESLREGLQSKTKQPKEYKEGEDPDKGIEFNQRNFFARGGELYYLMLVAGLRSNEEVRSRLVNRLVSLLTEHHREIEAITTVIENAWKEVKSEFIENEEENNKKENKDSYDIDIGWLPDRDCKLFEQMVSEVDTLLSNDINQLEMLHLLNYLIAFHLVQYMYRRSHNNCNLLQSCTSDENLSCCRPILMIDAIENTKEGSEIRNLSARLFRRLHDQQINKAQHFVTDFLYGSLEQTTNPNELEDKIRQTFNMKKPKNNERDSLGIIIYEWQNQWTENKDVYKREKAQEKISMIQKIIFEYYEGNLNKHALSVHRRLVREMGILVPSTGAYQRLVMPDAVLKMLVLSILKPGENMTIDEFVLELWKRYGIVLGPNEAELSGLIREPIDRYHYDKNLYRFQQKLLNAGLAIQYSDATCLVQNSFSKVVLEGVVSTV